MRHIYSKRLLKDLMNQRPWTPSLILFWSFHTELTLCLVRGHQHWTGHYHHNLPELVTSDSHTVAGNTWDLWLLSGLKKSLLAGLNHYYTHLVYITSASCDRQRVFAEWDTEMVIEGTLSHVFQEIFKSKKGSLLSWFLLRLSEIEHE